MLHAYTFTKRLIRFCLTRNRKKYVVITKIHDIQNYLYIYLIIKITIVVRMFLFDNYT